MLRARLFDGRLARCRGLHGREVHRLVGEVGLGDSELELGEVKVFKVFAPAGGGDFQVREMELGVASQATPAGQLIDIDDAEPPGSTIKKSANLAMLRLGLEVFGAQAQNPGGFFQSIELCHGRGPRGRKRPMAAVVGSNHGVRKRDRDEQQSPGERSPVYRTDCAKGLTVASIAAGSGAWLL